MFLYFIIKEQTVLTKLILEKKKIVVQLLFSTKAHVLAAIWKKKWFHKKKLLLFQKIRNKCSIFYMYMLIWHSVHYCKHFCLWFWIAICKYFLLQNRNILDLCVCVYLVRITFHKTFLIFPLHLQNKGFYLQNFFLPCWYTGWEKWKTYSGRG